MKKAILLFNIYLFLVGPIAEARVFDINKEIFASYFGFTGGSSAIGKSAFEKEAGSNLSYSSSVEYNYSGEFGFLVSNPYVSLRFGLEILKPQHMEALSVSSGASQLYSLDSEIMGYIPKFGLEFNIQRTNTTRSFIAAIGGYGNMILKNIYTLTAAGSAAYPGMATQMDAKGGATLISVNLGFEALLSDTTTFLFECGYRQMKISNLIYTTSGNYFGSTHAIGDDVLTSGNHREIDFTGTYLGISFRFYM